MAGITRIKIVGNMCSKGARRFIDSEMHFKLANDLYKDLFSELNTPLEDGDEIKEVTPEDFDAGYDKFFGIDVILKFKAGYTATIQEKFLFTTFNTVTVEYMQDWRNGIDGDWANLRCQYYFVGYDYNYSKSMPRKLPKFDNWILLDWSRVQRLTAQNLISWKSNINKHDGALASFKYVPFELIPTDAVVACYRSKINATNKYNLHKSIASAYKQVDFLEPPF